MTTPSATAPADATPGHAGLMDEVYRFQRHIYDATRKYFLFGRDAMIARLALPAALSNEASPAVLEIGCGTGRNLARVAKLWPTARLYGLDISAEMLKTAAARLTSQATLREGDACSFDAAALFGRAGFDRVMISFALSMIPDWHGALAHASTLIAPGGALHIVDFGDGGGLPAPLRALLGAWLRAFHVTVRADLIEAAAAIAEAHGLALTTERGAFGYYTLITLARPEAV